MFLVTQIIHFLKILLIIRTGSYFSSENKFDSCWLDVWLDVLL